MGKDKVRCWRPVRRPPIVTEEDLFPEDLVLRRLREKYTYHRIPTQIFGKVDCRGTSDHVLSTSTASTVRENFQLKQEPVTPCQSPAPFHGNSVARATSKCHQRWMMLETNVNRVDQLFPPEIKVGDVSKNITPRDSHQQTKLKLHGEEETYHLFRPGSGSGQEGLHVLHDDDCENRQTKVGALNFCHKERHVLSPYVNDSSHSLHTSLPVSAGQSQTFSPSLAQQSKSVPSENSAAQQGYNSPQGSSCTESSKFPLFSSTPTEFLHPVRNSKPQEMNSSRTFQATADCKTAPLKIRGMPSSDYNIWASDASDCDVPEQAASITKQRKDKLDSASHNSELLVSVTELLKKPPVERPRVQDTLFTIPLLTQQKASVNSKTYARKDSVCPVGLDSFKKVISTTSAAVTSSSFVKTCQKLALSRSVDTSSVSSSPVIRSPIKTTEKQPAAGQPSRDDSQRPAGRKTEQSKTTMSKEDNSIKPACDGSRKRSCAAVDTKCGPEEKALKGSRDRIQNKLKSFQVRNKNKSTSVRDKTHEVTGDCNNSSNDSDSLLESVEDVSIMNEEQRQCLATWFETCTCTVSFLVLYQDNSVNTDSSLLSRPKVRGILLHCEKGIYMLPTRQYYEDDDVLCWIRSVLRSMLLNSSAVKVAFDCKHFVITLMQEFSLGSNRETQRWQFEDPVIAGWLLNPDNPPHTLQELQTTVGITSKKDGRPLDDLVMASNIMNILRCRLRTENLWRLFYFVEMPLTCLLAVMDLQPIRVDVQAFISFSDVLKKKLDKVECEAYRLAGHPFCINSTQQLRQLLYEELQLDHQLPACRKVTLTAAAHHKSTSEPVLRQLIPVHPLPAVILQYRHLLKLKSTYIDGMLEAVHRGMLHTHWDQTAAATGRLASCHPNLQAIPKTPTTITNHMDNFIVGSEPKSFDIYAREPFICNKGCVFLAADFQQIELRLLAHLTKDAGLKEMFSPSDKATDVFVQLTAQWLSKPCCDVTHAEREQTKRIVYSILYGVGKEKLSEYLKVSSSRAVDIMDSFLVTFPAIQVFTRKCISYAKQYGYTETVMGRRRWFPKVHSKAANVRAQAERQAVNFCVQGSAADLCKRAMLKVEEALRGKPHLSARMLIHIHDELVWELPDDQLKETCELIKCVMEDDVLLCQPLLPSLRVPVTVSLSSGTSWAHLKPCV